MGVIGNTGTDADQQQAARERAARRLLLDRTNASLERPSAVELLETFVHWAAQDPDDDQRDAALAALSLLPAARAEVDALESGVLFAAKATGLTWAQMAAPMGLGSAQASQQRLERLLARQHRS